MQKGVLTMPSTLTTARFTLRTVFAQDAEDLFLCYSDPEAVARMNSDNCQGSFLMPAVENVRTAIGFWQNDPCLERLSILDGPRAIGTAELHCKEEIGTIVLRLDLCSAYEAQETITELVNALTEEAFRRYPAAKKAVLKSRPEDAERCAALLRCGFAAIEDFLGFPHYYELPRPYRGVAYCGLVCAHCSERFGCAGCKMGGCDAKKGCKPYTCGCEKGHLTCAACENFPCDAPILRSLRMRTFARYAHLHGEEALLRHLARKAEAGVLYHRNGLIGDYDGFASEEALIAFLES
jgi:RimJ/RimL family protein N-acetyltransferase